jgi:hypothetical protein
MARGQTRARTEPGAATTRRCRLALALAASVAVLLAPAAARAEAGGPGTLRVDPGFGRQSVSLDGVSVLATGHTEPVSGALQRLAARYGSWTTCDTGDRFGEQFTGRWSLTWDSVGVDVWTVGDPRIATCSAARSGGRIGSIDLRTSGSLVVTPLGAFRVDQRVATLPVRLRRALIATGTTYYSLPLESSCRPGSPVSGVGAFGDILGLVIRLTPAGQVDPQQHIAVVSSSTYRGVGC